MSSTSTSFIIIGLLFWACHSWTSVGGSSGYRRILHEPFIPHSSLPPAAAPTSSSLHSEPQNQQPKRPSSNSNSSTTTTTADAAGGSNNNNKPFFPSVSPPSRSPPPPHSVVATFPANISSLVVPESPSSRKTSSTKFVAVAAAVVSAIVLSIVALVLYYRPQQKSSGTGKGPWSDSLRLHPTDASTSDGLASAAAAANSSELPMIFLAGADGGSKLGSPEIRPLPPLLPLPQHNLRITRSGSPTTNDEEEEEHEEEEEFFSPRGSLGGGGRDGSSPSVAFHAIETLNFCSISPSESSNFVSPDRSPHGNPSPLISSSPRSLNSESSDSAIIFSAPLLPPPLFLSPSPPSSPPAKSNPPPPPPPPLPRFWKERVAPAVVREPNSGPPAFVAPSRPIVVPPARQLQRSGSVERTEDTPKPKLKPLHWDKVRASSDRAMVWDQLNSSSFQLNEEMIETLFVVNGSNLNQKDCHWRPAVVSMVNQENRVLDPKKSQNIAILLRALNVTIDEVCEALLEGNADALGSELLESLLKMAPTKVEEHKLKEYNDQSPFKLGPAEKFLKAVIDIPFAFKRVDSMLYIANFDSEVEYLGRAFETLEAACVELRNSKMFLKLLEAVLKTGNRMNVGTVRGDALAFKLDTLLKLVDIKGTDGKTTLLHFVVQEIIRSEGSRLSGAKHNENQTNDKPRQYDLRDDVEFRKLGLQVVSSLSGELSSIKKAASMDSDVLSSDVAALAGGISKVREVRELNEHALMEGRQRFSESMSGFLEKAEEEILRIQAQETTALSLVKEITEYFHGSSAKEEAHPFRIFTVVRDFLSILDHVCKEVRRINERTIVSSGRQLPQFGYPTVPPVFPGFSGRHHGGSSEED